MNIIPMDDAGWLWFNSKLPVLAVEDSCGFLALSDSGDYIGGCVLDNWTDTSVQGHFLIENPLIIRSKFLHVIGTYIFEERGKKLAYALIPGDNEKALKFNSHIGFTEVARLKGAFKEGVDCVILELKKENCVYLLDEVA